MLKDPDLTEGEYALLDAASAKFLNHVKMHYTRDTAVEVMNALQPILGKEWAGRLLFNLLADNHHINNRVQIRVDNPRGYQKIRAIKTVRSMSGMSLTEAKNIVENSEHALQYFTISIPPGAHPGWLVDNLAELRLAGVRASYE